ncbi:MAG: serine/threonine protein phosphatase [Oscillospiraceae bacterium]|nr:serine/threonine protein phosphatase [Oscillospiraceae bacterium]
MKWFKAKEPRVQGTAVQTRDVGRHPFGALDRYVPLGEGETRIYRAIREAVPIVDAAILKLIRLCGGVSVVCQEQRALAQMDEFLRTVPTGRGQRGLQSFLDGYLDCMFTCGRAVGEIVPDRQGRDVAALLWCDPAAVDIREGDNPLEFQLCRSAAQGGEPFPRQELLLFTPFQPEANNPYGVSLLRSMPFMSEILLKIYQAVGLNWERVGNVRFAVVCKNAEGDEVYARERCEQVAREWSRAMQDGSQGTVRDFVAMGDVEIKVIGADNQVLDSEVPVRQILEQLIARTGIPPFMLGLSWSSTERMSSQQADLMTSEITAIRRSLEPVIERICEAWLRLRGWGGSVRVEWAEIDMQDEVEQARAELYRRQAEQLKGDGEE